MNADYDSWTAEELLADLRRLGYEVYRPELGQFVIATRPLDLEHEQQEIPEALWQAADAKHEEILQILFNEQAAEMDRDTEDDDD